jgi:hypothetical protein
LSKPAVGSEKHSRRSCTQQQKQQQQQPDKDEQDEATVTATKQENARERKQRNLKKKEEEEEAVIAMPESVPNGHFANRRLVGDSEPSTHQYTMKDG